MQNFHNLSSNSTQLLSLICHLNLGLARSFVREVIFFYIFHYPTNSNIRL